MKKLVFLFAIALCANFAMAQTSASVEQDVLAPSADWHGNKAVVKQVGTEVSLDAFQKSDAWNDLKSEQIGSNITIDLNAEAGYTNQAYLTQVANNSSVDIDQTAGYYNHTTVRQYSDNSTANLYQVAGPDGNDNNIVRIYQGVRGAEQSGNSLVGAGTDTWDYAVVEETEAAMQVSEEGTNEIEVKQEGNNNTIGLNQDAVTNNWADMWQIGSSNELSAFQVNTGGNNSLFTTQYGNNNTASVMQSTTVGANNADIFQH